MKQTQTQKIISELEAGKDLSFFDFVEMGITNHTGRMSDVRYQLMLEGKGRRIKVRMEEKNGKKWAVYSMYEPEFDPSEVF